MKHCSTCKEEKEINNFRINNKKTGKLRSQCKDCERTYGRSYNRKNKHIRIKWRDNNLDKLHKLQADWYQRNKNKREETNQNRYQSDPIYKIKQDQKRKYQYAIKKDKQLRNWIEYNFTPEMNWDNYSSYWDIDHVVPICQWNLLDSIQVAICYDWKNMQPYPKNHNMTKKGKIDYSDVYLHKESLTKYMKFNSRQTELEKYIKLYYHYLSRFYLREVLINQVRERIQKTGESEYLRDILLREIPESLEYNPQMETSTGDQE